MGTPFRTSSDGIFLYHQRLSAYKWLWHGFSLRRNPMGEELSYSVNGFQPCEAVLENRRRLVYSICGREVPLAVLRQVHSDRVLLASSDVVSDSLQGDGWVTGEPGLLAAIQTADCLPVLLVDPVQRVVAAVHAGWRGTCQRIAAKAVCLMQTGLGSHPRNCLAVVGPAIGKCCYEVGEEVVEAFTQEFPHSKGFFSQAPSGKATRANSQCLNLAAACRSQLLDAGLTAGNIFTDGPCTACETDRFFSHRADAGRAGRMMSMIGIVELG
jgi:YfiH family protein